MEHLLAPYVVKDLKWNAKVQLPVISIHGVYLPNRQGSMAQFGFSCLPLNERMFVYESGI
jgi:hypothetical protein